MRSITFFIAALLILATATQAQVTNGLVAEYNFNNGTAQDALGINNGTYIGASPTTDRFGNPNKAFSFDGINDYILINDSSEFQMGTSDFSISLWLYFTETQPQFGNIIGKQSGDMFQHYTQYALYVPKDSNQVHSNIRTNTGFERYCKTGNLMGDWHHLVLVHEYADSSKIYVDGLLVDGKMITLSGHCDVTNHALSIGNFFKGKIDDVKIYKRALNDAEINLLFNANNPILGVEQHTSTAPKIAFSPNPTKGEIHFSENVNVMLINSLGQTILHKNNSQQIDVSNTAPGIYFLLFFNEQGQCTQTDKVIKE